MIMRHRYYFIFIMLVGLLLSTAAVVSATPQTQPVRLALVIGNRDYDPISPLPNAISDAEIVAAKLSALGFNVKIKRNLNGKSLDDAVNEFGNDLRNAGSNSVSFFFYAGHAAQDAARLNYLLPVDAEIKTASSVREQGIPIQRLLEDMDAANNDVNIVVLDACRDWLANDHSIKLPRGLHDMGRHGSIFIAFATSPDTTADDGGGKGSPYTARLVEALSIQPKDPLALLFDDVDARVYSDTDKAQTPEYMNGLARAPRWQLLGSSPPTVASLEPPETAVSIAGYLTTLDRDKLLLFTKGNITFTDALLSRRDILAKYGITTPMRLAYFLSTIKYETGDFRFSFENFNYSLNNLLRIFPKHFHDPNEALPYLHNPERIANLVYANKIGNGDEKSGDGWRFRGRGLFMISGRANYDRVGKAIKVDLVSFPDLLNNPETGLAAAAAIWSDRGLNKIADEDSMDKLVQRLVGPAPWSLGRRKIILDEAKKVTGIDGSP
jgi:putative chitinase